MKSTIPKKLNLSLDYSGIVTEIDTEGIAVKTFAEHRRPLGHHTAYFDLHDPTGQPLGIPPFPARISFSRGGTAIAVVSNPAVQLGQRTPSLGAWHATGPQTFSLVHEAFILFDGGIFHKGTHRITETIQVNGDQYASVASSQFYDATGAPIGNPGCSTRAGQRMTE